jgi:hypothetical protein
VLNRDSLASLVMRDRLAWLVVAGVSLLTLVCLASPGRFPGVDLAQHALILRRMLEGGGDYYLVDWATPYLLFYGIAAFFAQWMDPVRATWLATSFSVALLPVAAATLSVALGRSPALGLFALLSAFSSVVAWGFSSLVLGASMMAFSIAAALGYAGQPTTRRAMLLAALLFFTYFAHSLAWMIAVFTCWFVVIVWRQSLQPRLLWPLAVSTIPTVILMVRWSSPGQRPWLSRYFMDRRPDIEPTFDEKLFDLAPTAAALGHPDALLLPWTMLAAFFVVAGAIGLAWAVRTLARERRAGAAPAGLSEALAELRRLTPPLIWLTCVACYFIAPLWVGGVYLVYPRFILLAGVLTPAAILASRSLAIRTLALAAAIPALWLVSAAGAEVESFARTRACIDELTKVLREDETLLSLPIQTVPPGYDLPMDLHIHAEMVARRGGYVGMDFVDFGAAAVVHKPGVDRLVAPPNVVWALQLYEHERQGGEFSAWIVQGPPGALQQEIDRVFHGPSYRVTTCGGYGLVQDISVEPGTLAHVLYLPHRDGHPADGCNAGDHHAEKLPQAPPAAAAPPSAREKDWPSG